MSQTMFSELIAEANADEVGLWLIIARLREERGIAEPGPLRAATMGVARELLDSGDVAAGYYDDDGHGIATWNLSVDDVIYRINQEWDKLGRAPSIGEVVVFVGRSPGRKRGRSEFTSQ